MKKNILHFIKITLALFLFLQVGEVSAQSFVTWNAPATASAAPITGTFSGGTVTVSQGTTGVDFTMKSNSDVTNLNGATSSQSFTSTGLSNFGGTPPSKKMIFTFSKPVIINEFTVADIDAVTNSFNDAFTFEGISFTSVSGVSCNYTVTSATPTTFSSNNAEYARWLTSTTAITSFTINFLTTGTAPPVTHAVLTYAMKVTDACASFTTTPTLSSTTIANACPVGTVNLNSLVTSTLPTGASLKWYKDNTHTTEVTTPTAVATSGTYYAFYYDSVANCYSPASGAVTATVTLCPVSISNTCPSSSVDLALSLASTNVVPSGYTLTYHSGTPATTANKLTSSVVTTAGTYYGAYFLPGVDCYTATGRPLVVTITDCCAAKIAPDLTN